MKKTVLTFGLISGAVASGMMLVTLPLADRVGHGGLAEVFGYTTLVLASLLIFFGIRSFRDNVAGGSLTFMKGAAVGVLIALIASACYVATWELINYKLKPGFGEKYAASMVERVRASGASQEKIEEAKRQAEEFKIMYAKPLVNIGMTFMEIFPVGLVVTLISAGVLRRKQVGQAGAAG